MDKGAIDDDCNIDSCQADLENVDDNGHAKDSTYNHENNVKEDDKAAEHASINYSTGNESSYSSYTINNNDAHTDNIVDNDNY